MTRIRVLDLETTGIPSEADPHAIVQWGTVDLLLCDDGWKAGLNPRGALVHPGRSIPVEAMAVHHITDADVAGCDSPDVACLKITDRDNGMVDYFAAHNADFESQFYGSGVSWICTLKAAYRVFPDAPSHSLQVLRYYLKLDEMGMDRTMTYPPHHALPDAYVASFLLKRLLDEGASIADMVKWSKGPALLPRINFGKHRGTRWEDAPTDYLRWIADKSDMDRDVKANAKHHLKARAA